DQAIEAWFLQTIRSQKFGGFFLFHFGKFGFEAAADSDDSGVGAALESTEFVALHGGIELASFVIAEIEDIEHGALREKKESADGAALLGSELEFAQRLFGFEMRLAFFEDGFFELLLLVLLLFQFLFEFFKALRDLLVVGEDEL